ncbi:hypothetical protein D0X99_01975 [Algoriphagus lacus]|uniref:Uncharacterized protein n=1 Tax=Algoriphagus lacus TaxID=2056311 RepID=A0A418PWN6_9BACT|nr:hypothetical protein D0X99_01975 [Algoriphagus lacus]
MLVRFRISQYAKTDPKLKKAEYGFFWPFFKKCLYAIVHQSTSFGQNFKKKQVAESLKIFEGRPQKKAPSRAF